MDGLPAALLQEALSEPELWKQSMRAFPQSSTLAWCTVRQAGRSGKKSVSEPYKPEACSPIPLQEFCSTTRQLSQQDPQREELSGGGGAGGVSALGEEERVGPRREALLGAQLPNSTGSLVHKQGNGMMQDGDRAGQGNFKGRHCLWGKCE